MSRHSITAPKPAGNSPTPNGSDTGGLADAAAGRPLEASGLPAARAAGRLLAAPLSAQKS